jgi:DNA-directed RNA polymerase subunit RPC12/RpoP
LHTLQYKCPYCGGELVFDPEKQGFTCPFCRSDFTEAEIEARYGAQNAEAQQHADPDMQTVQEEDDASAFEEQARLYECPSCGAQIIAEETTSATFCYYCHNPVVLSGRLSGDYKPAYILPFSVSRAAAETAFQQWCRKRWFLPSDFRSRQQLEKMSGVYVPFWLANCQADAHLHGIGEKRRSWREGEYRVTEIREFEVAREADIPFTRIPADGARKIEDALMDAIEPFPYQEMRPFSMQYLSGFLSEKYDVPWTEAKPRIEARVEKACKEILDNTLREYTLVKGKTVDVQMQNLHTEYVLLPVWFMTYRHSGKTYSFAINGQTKKIAGTPPMSWAKLLLFCAALLVVITLLGGLIGGALL